MTTMFLKKSIGFQKSYLLTLEVYRITKEFPSDERYGLTSQMRRSASSIVFNISEGLFRRKTELSRFFEIARGSGGELETQLNLAKDLNNLLSEILKILNKSISTLRKSL